MDSDKYIFKTSPTVKLFMVGIIGGAFFGWIDYVMLSSKWNLNNINHLLGYLITFCMFGIFTLGVCVSLWVMIGFKQHHLTENELIITRPLLFTRRIVQITDIEVVSGEDYEINVADKYKGFFDETNKTSVYTGRKITLKLKGGEQLELKSFEIQGCQKLADEIKKQRKNLKWVQIHKP